jgi:hypothetical protein
MKRDPLYDQMAGTAVVDAAQGARTERSADQDRRWRGRKAGQESLNTRCATARRPVPCRSLSQTLKL